MTTITKTLSALSALALFAGSANAAVITYAGFQTNIESKDDDATTGWRNSTPTKPLDIDGDNILGTDGYYAFQNAISKPDYISTWVLTNDNSNWSSTHPSFGGVADDPASPTGTDTLLFGRWLGDNGADNSLFSFTIDGDSLVDKVLTVGILASFDISSFDVELRTVGGAASASASSLDFSGNKLDVAYFNITGAADGDVFAVVSEENITGFTFDSAVPEPGSLALLGLGGLCLIKRRRSA